VRQSRLAEVHLVVDHARQQVAPGGIEHVDVGAGANAARDLLDTLAPDQDVGVGDPAGVDQARIGNQQVRQIAANLSVADTSSWTLPGSNAA
jgi:hypothetical protein